MLKYLRSLFRVLKSRDQFEQNMGEELRFHIAEYTDELVRSGVPPQEAARRARIEFGSVVTVQEDCREARGLYLVDELVRQVRHAYRLLCKTPKFTATALATLAICLGANLTIFAVVDAILLRPLPFPAAGRLVTIFNTYPKAGVDRDGSSIANYYERRGQIPAFESLSLYSFGTAVVGEPGATEREQIMRVSPEFFATLETGPTIGRAFREEETSYGTDTEIVLSDAYWRKYFNADSGAIGKQIRVNGIANTVIGVLPPDFRFLSYEARLYFPYATRIEDRPSSQRHSGGNSRQLIARLKPGATIEQAQAQIDAQNTALEVNNPEAKMMADAGFRSPVVPLHGDHVAGIRPTLLWIQAGAIALLLIGAVNLTNLLLIRANSRAKEMAVRQALGASRAHVVSEVLIETTLLTLTGGLLGLIVGAIGIRVLAVLGAERLPLGSNIVFEARSALVVVLGSLLLGLAVAVPIAWFNLQGPRMNAMQAESRGGTSNRAAQGLRHAFIVGQIALALVLLSGAGLLGLSLERAMAVASGFRADHVLTGQISLPWSKYPDWNARLRFNETLLQQITQQPGVSSAGIINNVPLSGKNGKSATAVKGHIARPGESARANYAYGVDGDYFSAMGFTLREGRFLTADDSRRTERVCVVDEDFAHYYWPEGNAVGHQLFAGSQESKDADAFTVVGVVGAVKQTGLTDHEALGAVYYPYALRTDDDLFVVIRASVPPESVAMTLQGIVRKIDSDLPLNDVRTMDTRITDSLVANRASAMLAGIFSVIALLLTAVGTYGVVGYAVEQRRREIGVRMALGAQPEHIRAQFLTLALRLLAAGIVLGLIGAWLTGQAMRTLLFDVPPFHLATFAVATCVIGLVSLIACLLPSRRAARISPVEALAGET